MCIVSSEKMKLNVKMKKKTRSLPKDDGDDDYDEDAATPLEYHWAPENPMKPRIARRFLVTFSPQAFPLMT
jgi:hypothetical protein